jgi:hypothetical protein
MISVCDVVAPIQTWSARSSMPRSSGKAERSKSAPRLRWPSLACTSRSVPPASGCTSPGRWARISSASSSARGR